ncbi:peptide chain release factor H [Enterobacillus tribolii]|uniref:Peptide chain release factor n=1 Tax=Enterobacillus tribolii TaxID=1487935 RepID=A0A370QS10_9GAMM|nr:peptide chain release factor H [Enterobacillus tribolii]MBW7983453.1 peptide chain release factor H [Enterobacillus tribolii]RDK92052.1 peptide chain release factor [Enterobacillus tribolii]
MILLQLSAAQGPDECMMAVAKALARLTREAAEAGVTLDLLEAETGRREGTLRSALVALSGGQEAQVADAWSGTLLWICDSPWRGGGSRKNWYIGAARVAMPETLPDEGIRFDTLRASGPGGQHVNKTESAVRATHLASGISVKVQSERSQHANKRLARWLLEHKLKQVQQQQQAGIKAERRMFHHQLERGNPTRVFKGKAFSG